MNRSQSAKTYSLLAIGVVSFAVALMSSRIGGSTFYILSSGSMLLALLIASTALDVTFKGPSWMRERQQKPLPAAPDISYTSLHEQTAATALQKSPS